MMQYDVNYIDRIVSIAQEVESEDPIDWGMLEINEEDAYKLIAMNVVNQFSNFDINEREVMLATIIKLVVENFTLNLKIKGK